MQIAMVMVGDEKIPKIGDVQREFNKRWTDPVATEPEEKDGSLSLSIGDKGVVFGPMPKPIPWSDLEGPCATSVLWKDAAAQVKQHRTHVIAMALGDLNELEASALLTKACAAYMAALPSAIGVYWGNATLIVPKNIFISFAEEVLPEGPPLHIWVDFRVGPDSERTSAGFTAGMKALGHMEFETQNSPEPPGELRERLLALANYVVTNGPVIKDGDTVGEDEQEKIRVVYSPSAFGHKEKVMRLVYEKASASKPWWKLW